MGSAGDCVSRRVAELRPSGIRAFFELVIGREDVISLGVGEPDFSAPWHVREAAIHSLERGETSYTSNQGLLALRRAISDDVKRRLGMRYDPASEILVTTGGSEALDLAYRALANPGDEMLYHEPCYVAYAPGIALAGAAPVAIPTRAEDGWALRAEAVEAAITPHSKSLTVNFPCNPTGATLSQGQAGEIAALCCERDLVVISDEIYSQIRYGDAPHASVLLAPGMRERTLLLDGFSKAYAMTGFRIGYACGPAEIIAAMTKVHQHSMLCAPITAQRAGIEALRSGAASVERMRASYAQRRNLALAGFAEMGLPCAAPQGAFYAFPDVRGTGLDGQGFAAALLEEESVAVVPGDAFGACGAGCVRCCYAAAEGDVREALRRMGRFVRRRGAGTSG